MAKILLSNNSSSETTELPFLKEYIKNIRHDYPFGTIDYPVGMIYKNEKGLLVFTASFKVFLFANSKMSKQLSEALNAWSTGTKPLGYLYVMPLDRKGAMEIGLETAVIPEKWLAEEAYNMFNEKRTIYKQYLPQKEMEALGKTLVPAPENPFLNPTSSPTTGYGDNSPHPKGSGVPGKASRKP